MTSQPLSTRSRVKLGLVPTHLGFVEGLVPDQDGRLPRDADGELRLVRALRQLAGRSPVTLDVVQVPLFDGVQPDDMQAVRSTCLELGMELQLILMLGGGNPMLAEDEASFVKAAIETVRQAVELEVSQVSATSLEAWMQPGLTRKEGSDYEAAVEQLARVHQRLYDEAQLATSPIRHWHIEFLREGEFSTFTDLQRAWDVVQRANQRLGTPFFKVLVDAAHCGDSGLSIDQHVALLQQIAAADHLGMFHASAKTTRGCFSTDDGWIGGLLTAVARTGKLEYVLVEIFHHEDPALAALRQLDPRHGIDTRDGRSYEDLVLAGLNDVARRLNNLTQRGILPSRDGGQEQER